MTKSRHILRPRHRWTTAEVELLQRAYASTVTSELAQQLGLPVYLVYAKAHHLGLHKSAAFQASSASGRILRGGALSVATQFRPGQVPPNKGTRRPGYAPGRMRQTQFKKGQVPVTWKPVGSYRVNGDGYLDRKISDTRNSVRDWQPVHRLVWIEAHGPVPADHVVVFKPGRRSTELEQITLDAIELVTRRELMRRNTIHNLPKELASVIMLRGALNRQIKRRAQSSE